MIRRSLVTESANSRATLPTPCSFSLSALPASFFDACGGCCLIRLWWSPPAHAAGAKLACPPAHDLSALGLLLELSSYLPLQMLKGRRSQAHTPTPHPLFSLRNL